MVEINGLTEELEILTDEIRRKDGKGAMRIIPAQNATGQHGKTAQFIGYDEIHGYRDWDLMEALQPDPTRDVLQWITSYDTIYNVEGVPLHDLKQIGIAGSDPRMLFSWYSADLCTDPAFETFRLTNALTPRWHHGQRVRPISTSSAAGCRPPNFAACITICPAPLRARISTRALLSAPSSPAGR